MSKISLKHSGGNVVSLNSPTSAPTSADVAFKLPNADGTSGQAIVTDASGNLSFAGTGKILQVIQALKSDSQTFTSSSSGNDRYDITGLSVSITPSSSSNKILISYNVNVGGPNGGYRAFLHLMRGSTDIYRGDDASSRTRCSNFIYTRNDSVGSVPSYQNTGTFLDSPSTTSATTYKIQITTYNGGGNVYGVNTANSNPSNSSGQNPISQITVMEVAA